MDTSRKSATVFNSPPLRVCIAGGGFAGAILGRQLERHGVSVTVFERAQDMGESETGTGLNLNPNGLGALASCDPELERALRMVGLPRTRMQSTTMSGDILYSVPICKGGESDDLARNSGLRIRWRDASLIIRKACSSIQYGKRVTGYAVDNALESGCVSVTVLDLITGITSEHTGFDLLVAADGRYSCLRSALSGEPDATMAGVCNFRLLVQDTSGLFEDLELIYNDSPSIDSLPAEIATNPEVQHCFNGFPRFGVLKMPPTESYTQPSAYIFGNFPVHDAVPDVMKRGDVLRALYTPSKGMPDSKGRWLLDTLETNADRLHWARMQDIPFVMRDATGRLLLLGDASHAMVPTLGQGATTAIEDACVAAQELLAAIDAGGPVDIPTVTSRIEARALPRAQFISDVSKIATVHLCAGNTMLTQDVRDWTVEAEDGKPCFRDLMRQVWCGYPVVHSQQQLVLPH